MKIKRIILFIFLLIYFINVDAVCDNNRFNELKSIAEKVEFKYDYNIDNKSNINFTITAMNLNQEVKPLIIKNYYTDDYREFKYNSSKQSSLTGFKEGENVKITFKAYTADDCASKTVLTKIIKLPYYNNFYNSDSCKNNRRFKYCQSELSSYSISESLFNKELNNYLNNKDNNSNNDNSNNEDNKNKNSFHIDEYIGLIIIVFVILLLIILIIIKIKQVKKRNNL